MERSDISRLETISSFCLCALATLRFLFASHPNRGVSCVNTTEVSSVGLWIASLN